MADSTQVTHTSENNFFGGKNESGLIRFSIQSILIIATFLWFQVGTPNQNLSSITSTYASSDFAVNLTSLFSSTVPQVTSYPEATNPSVYLKKHKNGIGSDDDPVRLTPESKILAGINEPSVKAEVLDETIHLRNYTPNTSKAIQREAVNQRTDTSLKKTNKVAKKKVNEAFGSIVYHGDHFKEMESYVYNKPRQVVEVDIPTKPVAQFASIKTTIEEETETLKASISSTISTIKLESIKFLNIAAPKDVAPIRISDNASTTKQHNQLNDLKDDESEAIASVSSTQALIAKTGITSTQFHELSIEATTNEKFLLVRFTASWCAPCKIMERDVYPNPSVKAIMDQHFLSMKVDVESFDGINLKQKFDIQSVPSFLIFNSNGELVDHVKRSLSSKKMLKVLKKQIKEIDTFEDTDLLSKSEYDNGDLEYDSTPITIRCPIFYLRIRYCYSAPVRPFT